MKTEKKITIISIILLVLVIILASFVGIYRVKDFRVKNLVPNYLLSMEFNKTRNITMEVDDSIDTKILDSEGNEVEEKDDEIEYTEENGYTTVEEKVNADDLLTKENFEKAKSIIVNKLGDLKVKQYNIKQNLANGTINVQIPENDDSDKIVSALNQNGKFEVTDEETGEVLLNKSHIASTSVVSYTQADNSVLVAVRIELNKEGKKIFSEMSNKYVQTTETVTDEETGETKDEEQTKNVNIEIDGQTYFTNYFQKNVKAGILKYLDEADGVITLPLGLTSEQEQLKKYADNAENIKILLDNKEMPIKYSISQEMLSAEITDVNIFIYIGIALAIITFIINIFKFKLKGIVLSLLQIGYIALLMLVIRYTNVVISLDGMIGIVISVLINFIFGYAIIKNISGINETFKKYLLNLIPIYVVAIVLAFGTVTNISSLGMILFWGISFMYIYNILITKTILKAVEK